MMDLHRGSATILLRIGSYDLLVFLQVGRRKALRASVR